MTPLGCGIAATIAIVALGCTYGNDDDFDCEMLQDPVAAPGDPIGGDTYESFASGLFDTYCTRCHSTELSGSARNDAPGNLNWDDEGSVRSNLRDIRRAAGEIAFMPPNGSKPTCEERFRLARWIDADAP